MRELGFDTPVLRLDPAHRIGAERQAARWRIRSDKREHCIRQPLWIARLLSIRAARKRAHQ